MPVPVTVTSMHFSGRAGVAAVAVAVSVVRDRGLLDSGDMFEDFSKERMW